MKKVLIIIFIFISFSAYGQSIFWLNRPPVVAGDFFVYLGSQTWTTQSGGSTITKTSVNVPACDFAVISLNMTSGYMPDYFTLGLPTMDLVGGSTYTFPTVIWSGNDTITSNLFLTSSGIPSGTYTLNVYNVPANATCNFTIMYFNTPSTGYSNGNSSLTVSTGSTITKSTIVPTNSHVLVINTTTYRPTGTNTLTLSSNSDNLVHFGVNGATAGDGVQYKITDTGASTSESLSWTTTQSFLYHSLQAVFIKN